MVILISAFKSSTTERMENIRLKPFRRLIRSILNFMTSVENDILV